MANPFPRCRIVPQANNEVAIELEGIERTRWHFGPQYPRPFFFPFIGPSGESLTRMGHPGAANHDHHRSIWFAHHNVDGQDFWSDGKGPRIRQQNWIAYTDGEEEAILGFALSWLDANRQQLLQQELIVALWPGPDGETFLEVQSSFLPHTKLPEVRFNQNNFGIFAVRVARHISAHFGAGQLTNNSGARGESDIFGKPASWMDYSGPTRDGEREGITLFDHPANPPYPSKWHVREDGWMGPSLTRDDGITVTQDRPLVVRYLLHAHAGDISPDRAESVADAFADRPGFIAWKSAKRHRQFEIRRKG